MNFLRHLIVSNDMMIYLGYKCSLFIIETKIVFLFSHPSLTPIWINMNHCWESRLREKEARELEKLLHVKNCDLPSFRTYIYIYLSSEKCECVLGYSNVTETIDSQFKNIINNMLQYIQIIGIYYAPFERIKPIDRICL